MYRKEQFHTDLVNEWMNDRVDSIATDYTFPYPTKHLEVMFHWWVTKGLN